MSVSVQQGAPTQKRCLNTAELSDQGEKLTADIEFFQANLWLLLQLPMLPN